MIFKGVLWMIGQTEKRSPQVVLGGILVHTEYWFLWYECFRYCNTSVYAVNTTFRLFCRTIRHHLTVESFEVLHSNVLRTYSEQIWSEFSELSEFQGHA